MGKMFKDGKYLVPRSVIKEVVDHLHKLFHVGTQRIPKMPDILRLRIQSPKLVDINKTIMDQCVHCQANKHRNVRLEGFYQPMPVPEEPSEGVATFDLVPFYWGPPEKAGVM